jgi:hypothetical protein
MLVGIRSTWAGIVSGSVTLLAMGTPSCFLRSAEGKPSRIGREGQAPPLQELGCALTSGKRADLEETRVLPFYVVVLVECAAFETRGLGVDHVRDARRHRGSPRRRAG